MSHSKLPLLQAVNSILDMVYDDTGGQFFTCAKEAQSLMLSSGNTQPMQPCSVTLNITTQPSSGCAAESLYIDAYEDELTSLVLSMDILSSVVLTPSSLSMTIPPSAFFEEDGVFSAYIVSSSTQATQAISKRR